MEGRGREEGWGEDDEDNEGDGADGGANVGGNGKGGREGKWGSGRGRCAVTGRRVLGGVDGLRRVMV